MNDIIQRETLRELDGSLLNFQKAIRQLSDLLYEQIAKIEPEETDPFSVIRGAESLSKTIEKLVIVAPFLLFRTDFEAIERFKDWLTSSTVWIGEKRSDILQALMAYQQELIAQTDPPTSKQMTLI